MKFKITNGILCSSKKWDGFLRLLSEPGTVKINYKNKDPLETRNTLKLRKYLSPVIGLFIFMNSFILLFRKDLSL